MNLNGANFRELRFGRVSGIVCAKVASEYATNRAQLKYGLRWDDEAGL